MHKAIFIEQAVVLALGWVALLARVAGAGLDAGTLWIAGFLVALTLSLALVRWLPEEPPRQGSPSWMDRLAASGPGKVAAVVSALALTVGVGSLVGVLVCAPVRGVAETISGLPGVLVEAAIGAAMSMVGFAVFFVLVNMLGPVLSIVYEGWTMYVASVVGGVVGAALASGGVGGVVSAMIASGCAGRGIVVVGISALAGALALLVFEASTSKKRIRIADVRDILIAGLGFGFINGLILALFYGLLALMRDVVGKI